MVDMHLNIWERAFVLSLGSIFMFRAVTYTPFSTIRVADFSILGKFRPKPQLNCSNRGIM